MTRSAGDGAAVGTSVPRVDGLDKVTGRAAYIDDIARPGELYGSTVRSQVAHGVLRGIHKDPDFDWTGITLVTAEDIPGDNYVALLEEDQPALVPVGGTINHIEEPVALVAAADARRAEQAREHVRLEIDELPAIFDVQESIDRKVVLHGDDNVFSRYEILKGANVDEVLAACDRVIESVYETGAQEQMYIEPQGITARWQDGACYISGSMQCPYYVHKAMKPLLGIDPDKIIIGQTVTGGGFGGKEEYPSMLAAHAAVLSRAAAAPVKMIYDRGEDIRATTKRHPARITHRLGLNADGTIAAIDVDVVIDGGAYVTLSPVVLSRAVLHAAGPYRCDNVRIVGRAVATNTAPHGAFRGFGAPQTTFANERQMQKAARALGMNAFEFRRLNMLRKGDSTATSQTLTFSIGSESVLESVARVAGDAPTTDAGPATRRGRGLAFYFHGAGFTGSGEARLAGRATVALREDGRFEVLSSSTDIGQGASTMFAQIAATALGVDPSQVTVASPSTDVVPDSGPTVASRTCMVVGSVVDNASQKVRGAVEAWGAANGMKDAGVGATASAMAEAGERPEATCQYEPPPGIEWDDATYTGSAYPVFGWAACMVDVSVDLDSYEVTVDRCVHAVDIGKAINPIIVKGQIEGGTLQALGWALLEAVVYDRGRVVNASMTDCIVPTFADAPEMETIIVEEPYPFGPHGAKGVGEIPMDGPAAAVADAVESALGVPFDRLPILPESIARALDEEGGA